MTELFIGTLSASASAGNYDDDSSVAGAGNLQSRMQDMLAHLGDRRLEEMLGAAEFPDGEWCLRRLDLRVALDPARPGPALETQWAHAVVQELGQRIGSGSDDVLHFPRITDALNDLAASLAAGRTEHAWAWRQLGLLLPEDPDPAGAPGPALLAVLRRRPEQALAAIVTTVETHGAAPLHRLLAGRGWFDLAAIVAAAAGAPWAAGIQSLFSAVTSTAGDDTAEAFPSGRGTAGNVTPGNVAAVHSGVGSVTGRGPDSDRGAARRLPDHGIGAAEGPSGSGHPVPFSMHGSGQVEGARLAEAKRINARLADERLADACLADERLADAQSLDVARRSRLARAILRSGLRPDIPTAAAWALLAATEADPGLLRRPDAAEILRSLASRFLAPGGAGQSLGDTSRSGSATGPTGAASGTGPAAVGRTGTGGADNRRADVRADKSGITESTGTESSSTESTSTGANDLRTSAAGHNPLSDGPGRDVPGAEADSHGTTAGAGSAGINGTADGNAPTDGTADEGTAAAGAGRVATGEDPTGSPAEAGSPTLWAGLPFLLATADGAGIPDLVLTDPALTERPLRWIIHRLGQLLVPAAPDDPSVMALAGLTPTAEAPDGGRHATAEGASAASAMTLEKHDSERHTAESHDLEQLALEQLALEHHAARWAEATAGRLGRPHHDPFDVVAEIAFRRGEVLAQNGWIEVHLSLRDVDVDVRRAGLDIDPGWVPWLGVVVRFVYE